jgi:hypothetical protein
LKIEDWRFPWTVATNLQTYTAKALELWWWRQRQAHSSVSHSVRWTHKRNLMAVDGDNQHVMLTTCTCCPTACTCLCDMSMRFLAESNTHPSSDGQTACKN